MGYDYYSDQLANIDTVPPVMLKPNESGKVRCKYFNYTIPAGDLAITKTLELVRLRKGQRILLGLFAHEALSTAGGTAGAEIGDGSTSTKFKTETDVDGAGFFQFASTPAENQGLELDADTSIVVTVKTEAWAATKKISGYVLYLGD